MKVTELRIGNKIYGQSELETTGEMINHLCTVLCLDSADIAEWPITVESESNREWFEGFIGIPLTDEWLEKFGLRDKEERKGEAHFHNGGLYRRKDRWEYSFEGVHFTTIQYVHELQNLSFALNSEELEIKD